MLVSRIIFITLRFVMRRYFISCIIIFFCSCLTAIPALGQNDSLPELKASDLEYGSLIFAINEHGNSITQSTTKAGDFPIDHVGIIYWECDAPYVIEATRKRGVTVTDLPHFLKRNPVCVVGKVSGVDVFKSVNNALEYHDLPYDYLFEPDDSAIYCSELVQKSFVDSTGNKIFNTIPMSFHDTTGRILPYWIKFYQKHGRSVPEGEPGTNPSQLAKSPKTKLYGMIRKKYHAPLIRKNM